MDIRPRKRACAVEAEMNPKRHAWCIGRNVTLCFWTHHRLDLIRHDRDQRRGRAIISQPATYNASASWRCVSDEELRSGMLDVRYLLTRFLSSQPPPNHTPEHVRIMQENRLKGELISLASGYLMMTLC